jgi:hypothetical protein
MKTEQDLFKSSTTPAGAVALEVLGSLRNIWVELWKLGTEEKFFIQIIEPMAKDPALSGVEKSLISDGLAEAPESEVANEQRAELKDEFAWDKGTMPSHAKAGSIEYSVFETACEFCVQAIRVQMSPAPADDKWRLTCEAKDFLGILRGYISGIAEPAQKSSFAELGAYARHAEHRAMKAEVFEWCVENHARFKKRTAAAMVVHQTLQPIEYSTAYSWISEWEKLQSAGKL